ncbi:hypothetical protein [Plasmodium yoelii yoelii]|uniref:Uncharacterized protein n=1 Tax=Plasmodium yoelii yoelii TaxID=73239 RepID=Q7RIE4_PLAYO|nr:hypothetical protein [Plasmodium yoelii yoelii]
MINEESDEGMFLNGIEVQSTIWREYI